MYYPSAVGSVMMPSVVAPAHSMVAAPGMMMPASYAQPSYAQPSYAQPAYGYGHSYAMPPAMPAYHAAPPVYHHQGYGGYGYRAPTVIIGRRSRWRRRSMFGYY